MDALFPFGLPRPTAFYLTLLVLTFALSQALMHYVLAGSLHVAWTMLFPGKEDIPRDELPLAATLRDWMPFYLSAAITAGVAPLLFMQIVYPRSFYSANLLLWWRWMLVVPVLIVAFYLLYLIKSSMMLEWHRAARGTVGLATAGCFVFVGFCFTANHLLGNRENDWPDVYRTGEMPFTVWEATLRMLIWLGGSLPTMSVIAGWQLKYRENRRKDRDEQSSNPTLSALSMGGLLIAVVASLISVFLTDGPTRQLLFGNLALPFVVLMVVGAVLQLVAWIVQWRLDQLNGWWLTIASLGAFFCLLSVSVIREVFRMKAINLESLTQSHAAAARIGGFPVFVIAAVIVSLLIVWCVKLVRDGTASPPSGERRTKSTSTPTRSK